MSDTAVSLLTAPGTGAIATVCIHGSRAWELARTLFTPNGKPLPEFLEVNRFWFGTLGQDEVILAALTPDTLEVHCHGGQRVVRWVIEQFLTRGCVEVREPHSPESGWQLLQRAQTLRTANILLDQLNGAFTRETERLLMLLETAPASAAEPLAAFADRGERIGRYLVEPWRVVIAGEPNVGKSSIINALAGFQRSVVSEVAGTTRDTVSVRTAFDGWPVELIDTAGLRDATGLEAAGIELAREVLRTANRLVWVIDATAPNSAMPDWNEWLPTDDQPIVVANKCDLPHASVVPASAIAVSAKTGAGIAELSRAIIAHFPATPPYAGVAYTPRLAEFVSLASQCAQLAQWHEAAAYLRACLE